MGPSVWLAGGDDDDVLTGDQGSERLSGGLGNDTLVGRRGFDIYHFEDAALPNELDMIVEDAAYVENILDFSGRRSGGGTVPVFVDLLNTQVLATHGSRRVTGRDGAEGSIAAVDGSDRDDILRGNLADNGLYGGLGNDRIEGRGGDDVLNGGEGRDTCVFATNISLGSDLIEETSAPGIDTLDFSQTTSQSVTIDLAKPNAQIVNSNLTLTLGASG